MEHKTLTELIFEVKLATVKKLKGDIFSVSPLSEQIKELWAALDLYEDLCNIGRHMAT